jgi:hypothetical protein
MQEEPRKYKPPIIIVPTSSNFVSSLSLSFFNSSLIFFDQIRKAFSSIKFQKKFSSKKRFFLIGIVFDETLPFYLIKK